MARQVSLLGGLEHVVPAVAYVGVVFYLGSLAPGAQVVPSVNDKVAHALAFGAMLVLNLRALWFLFPALKERWGLVVASVSAFGLGGLLELHQLLLTRRSAELLDWIADGVGVLVAVLVVAVYLKWVRRLGRAPSAEG